VFLNGINARGFPWLIAETLRKDKEKSSWQLIKGNPKLKSAVIRNAIVEFLDKQEGI